MSLSQGARNKIKSFVQAAKKLLMSEFETQLQQFYGIRPNGTCLLVEELTSREASVIETARLLRQRLHYLESTIAGDNKAPEAVRQLVREQAFTILNRFAALRMSEERNIIRESIRNSYNSEGFLVYDQLTGGAKTADQFTRYKWYIGHVFDELAIDLPAVFDRFSPYALLFPSERVLLDLLTIINEEELNIYRESGHQPINLWKEDETIGWIYQYYNSREEISEMRDASDAPRNSRELAVRNQFFTPRYVVQFLVDNSLGRQWYEMTKGTTTLKDLCQYMVKQSLEIFLEKGEAIPETKVDGAHYVEFRALKDPREILFLDPACGSMHFGLYGFDLFEQIYIEAWDHHPALLRDLRDQYLREDFIKEIPGLILRYNIHGVDIDPRAIQIAGLSLWLRAQKSFDALNLQPADRPSISKSNLVIAEPLPGDKQLLSEFSKSLPGPIGKLVRIIWDKMQLAGETGLLLKIEEELKKEIEIARQEYEQFKHSTTQASLFGSKEENKVAEMAAIYGKGQKISKDFFDTAEEEVLKALKSFAENAEGEDAFQKLLFAEDTARGFAFIELCRKRYDVIVMNPPFGAGSILTEDYFNENYPNWGKNILCCFFSRMTDLLKQSGELGSIYDRTVLIKSSYESFRIDSLISKITHLIDTGWGVLDANVETTASVQSKMKKDSIGVFINLQSESNKEISLLKSINDVSRQKWMKSSSFTNLPNAVIGYDWNEEIVELFRKFDSLERNGAQVREGHNLVSNEHFRLFWEIKEHEIYRTLYNGGPFSMFYCVYREKTIYGKDATLVEKNKKVTLRNLSYHGLPGVCFGKRGDIIDAHIFKKDMIFTSEGKAIPDLNHNDALITLAFLNSSLAQYVINLYCGQHKHVGYINILPFPKLDSEKTNSVIQNTERIIQIKRKYYSFDETNLEYEGILNQLDDLSNIKNSIKNLQNSLISDHQNYYESIDLNDKIWLEGSGLGLNSKNLIGRYKTNRPTETLFFTNYFVDPSVFLSEVCQEIIQFSIGFVFARWNDQAVKEKNKINKSFFDRLPNNPRLLREIGERSNFKTLSNGFISNDKDSNYSLFQYLSSFFLETGINLENLGHHIENNMFNGNLENYINNPSGFFNYHYLRYTKSRREAPLFWPISTKSNSYTVWIYYPKLSESTLFSVINQLIEPKIKEISKMVEVLGMNSSAKELNDKKEFLAELEDFKEELLRVSQLPYKPNHDDGVLITAAPLNNLFRHSKWKKSTQDCWEKLVKGEYDWAHLAYSIWPERVRKKCKKDLSMAIVHGLEDICEVKPKEKKVKEIKSASQLKLD
ncbi:BREX-1 system adenine-specific DNA-methyltransferase PglX [Algoriphagus aquatilis]|uniref:site-specific DNA-methyltransferase (adenine-specific) n=1 Tax=Algoriphagus aquatilis TaxID=490186 RepID=A0ABW0BXT7_9BACT